MYIEDQYQNMLVLKDFIQEILVVIFQNCSLQNNMVHKWLTSFTSNMCSPTSSVNVSRHLPMDRCFTSQSDTYPWTGVSPVSQTPTHGQVFHQSVSHLPMDRCFISQSVTYPWTGVSPVSQTPTHG
jgi:hypothetical protein